MPKQKTHKGLAKRVKVTASGKVKRKKSFSGHLMSKKNGKRRRRVGSSVLVKASDVAKIKVMLGIN